MVEITRESILDEAKKCVCTDREQDYGPPENNFKIIAELWDTYIRAKQYFGGFGFKIHAHDVAVMMALLKIGRIASGQHKADNYVDLAGYAACAGEIAAK